MQGQLLQFFGSLAAVAALVAAAYLFGFRHAAKLSDDEEARDLFRLAPGGFEPVDVVMDVHGHAAIARDAAGREAVLVPHGNQFVVRLLPPETRVSSENGRLIIDEMPGIQIELAPDSNGWATTDIDGSSG